MDTADKDKAVILVATQVVEAGIDIDMDIGYKDISKLTARSSSSGGLTGILKEKVLSIFSIWIMKVVFIRRIIVLIQRIH